MSPSQQTTISTQKSHAINRSTELLSVARTALRIAQQEHESSSSDELNPDVTTALTAAAGSMQSILSLQPSDLVLHNNTLNINSTAKELLSEAMLTLNLLDETLKKLSNLVKRRGHTNDPTNDINLAMRDFQSFVQDIMDIIEKTLPQAAALPPFYNQDDDNDSGNGIEGNRKFLNRNRNRKDSSSQRRKHYEMAATTLKIRVEVRMEKFKNIMKVRGDVIKDLAKRREKLLKSDNDNSNTRTNVNNDRNHNDEKKTNSDYTRGGTSAYRGASMNTSMHRTPMNGGGVRLGALKKNSTMDAKKVKSQMNSPLFTMSSSKKQATNPYAAKAKPSYPMSNGGNRNRAPASNPYSTSNANYNSKGPIRPNTNAGYGGSGTTATAGGYGYGGAGYGGSSNIANSTGMRHRGGNNTNTMNNNNSYNPYQMEEERKVHDQSSDDNIQEQIQKRRQARQTQSRLESARMAEKTLAELATMFGKMSNLIQSQGETLVKIEDDVEIAMGYVDDGHEEVGKLYEWTQGNRGLIIKCFAILIFFIIFMRFYG